MTDFALPNILIFGQYQVLSKPSSRTNNDNGRQSPPFTPILLGLWGDGTSCTRFPKYDGKEQNTIEQYFSLRGLVSG